MKSALLVLCLLFYVQLLRAQLPILYYDFENNSTRSTFENLVEQSVNSGNSTISKMGTSAISGANGAGLFYAASVANGQAISASTWSNTASDPGTAASSYFQFTVNTSGFSGLSLQFDCYSASILQLGILLTAPKDVGILYSTDGTNFFTTSTQSTGTLDAWNHLNFDLSSFTAINNKSSVVLRLYGYNATTVVISEPMSIDNLQLNALSTVSNAGTKTMLNESNIYTSVTSGGTGSIFSRQYFTVSGSSTTVNMSQETFSGSGTSAGNLTVQDTAILNITSPVTIDSAIVANSTPLSILNIISNATVNLSGANLLCKGSGTVANTGIFNCGTNTVTNTGTFTVSAGGTLGIGATDGISSSGSTGNIQTTTRSFSTSGNYTYNGSANQVTGTGLPSSISNLIINNSSGNVSLTSNLIVNGQTSLTAGSLIIGSQTLTLNGLVSRTSGNFNGTENSSLMLGGSSAQDIAFDTNDSLGILNINKSIGSTATLNSSLNVFTGITFNSSNLDSLDLNNEHVTLKSTSTFTAYLGSIYGSLNNATNVTVERFIPARRAWRLLTAPITNSTSIYNAWQNGGVYTVGIGTLITKPSPSSGDGMDAGINVNYSMKTFNSSTQGLVNVANTMSSNISPGTTGSADNAGYFIFIRGDRNPATVGNPYYSTLPCVNTTLSSSGTLQTGNQVFTASSVAGKFTLIGNPYASPIDFNNVTLNNVIKRFYVWDPTLNQVGGYVVLDDVLNTGTFTKSVLASAQTNVLQSGQAFFVQTLNTAAASFMVSESSKSTSNNNLVFRPASTIASITTDLYLLNTDSTTAFADGAQVQFNDAFNAAVDWQDALKLGNINEGIGILRGTTNLSIERRPLITAYDTLFLKLTGTTARDYQFQFVANNIQQQGFVGTLIDNYLGINTPINLYGTTNVNFSVVSGITASGASNRFMIVFRPAGVTPVTFTTVKAYQKNTNIVIDWKVENELNIAQYEVEKSADGKSFTKVTITKSTGNNNSSVDYNWLDTKPFAGNNYYRIKSVDRTGDIEYSQIVIVSTGNAGSDISIYPNPIVNGLMQLHLQNQSLGKYNVHLINQSGQSLFTQSIEHQQNKETETVLLPNTISKGIYQLEIIKPNGIKITDELLIK